MILLAMMFPVPEKATCFADVGNVLLYVCWCVLLLYDAGDLRLCSSLEPPC